MTNMASSRKLIIAFTMVVVVALLIDLADSRKLCRKNKRRGTCQDIIRRKGSRRGMGRCAVKGGSCTAFKSRCLCDTRKKPSLL